MTALLHVCLGIEHSRGILFLEQPEAALFCCLTEASFSLSLKHLDTQGGDKP